MTVIRIVSIALRVAQFITAAVVLGLTAFFLHQYDKYHIGPFNRLVYSVVIAALSVWLSLLWVVLPHATWAHFGTDLIFCAAWFAVFGLLQDYYDDSMKCGSMWAWNNIDLTNNYCGQWNAAQAFSFLAAVFWFASFIVGILAWSKARHSPVATDGAPARRGFFRRAPRSQV
ncbi:uncharacterized protein M421DRAFT_110237 [Didymella exigua CBS 183.55]|uniref:MARVEL domain-containing protein n=1 Tax=Didymella exigua CBS 183.55 TaxID=1150837 RepID=A0A6A5S3I7_9PLEO|nr:uncharacterized protein M421DRAFT_110237 [Didymella exigua CBS 183.55]KAF1934004.1 hypothetical protein M421DRAFT_110237 [Didymella exigua CBS 183.55]